MPASAAWNCVEGRSARAVALLMQCRFFRLFEEALGERVVPASCPCGSSSSAFRTPELGLKRVTGVGRRGPGDGSTPLLGDATQVIGEKLSLLVHG